MLIIQNIQIKTSIKSVNGAIIPIFSWQMKKFAQTHNSLITSFDYSSYLQLLKYSQEINVFITLARDNFLNNFLKQIFYTAWIFQPPSSHFVQTRIKFISSWIIKCTKIRRRYERHVQSVTKGVRCW